MAKYKTIEEMITDLSYERPSSYIGPDYFGYLELYQQNRDSHLLEQYNYKALKEHLENKVKELKLIDDEGNPLILDIRDGHWAVGWIEFLRVRIDSKELMTECFKILNDLDSYPVFDDMEFSDFEHEAVRNWIEEHREYNLKELAEFLNIDVKKLPRDASEFCAYFWESSASYNGADDCYFDLNSNESLEYCLRYLKENKLESYVKNTLKLINKKLKV